MTLTAPPPIPFAPEPVAALRARYRGALAEVFDPGKIASGRRPGLVAANVFDCEDGLRLIVSLEDHGQGVHLHVSASVEDRDDCRLARAIVAAMQAGGLAAGQAAMTVAAECRLAQISGDDEPLRFLGFSSAEGIPHWWGPDPRPSEATP